VLTTTQDNEEIIERVAALDIGKAELMCCVRVPGQDHPGRRLQEVQAYPTLTRPVLRLADHLARLGVTRVVMEATADYWKPVFYLLERSAWRPGWTAPRTSSTCPAGPRPASWTRSGCARSPSGRCSARASCRRRRSASCGT
jgi:transposase